MSFLIVGSAVKMVVLKSATREGIPRGHTHRVANLDEINFPFSRDAEHVYDLIRDNSHEDRLL